MRTWEDCKREWKRKLERLRASNNEMDRKYAQLLEEGNEPLCFPPIGIELSLNEYHLFDLQSQDIKEIHGWLPFGRDIHERVRSVFRLPNIEDPNRLGPKIKETTPRKGYYWVLGLSETNQNILVCRYNAFGDKEFGFENVEINKIPLFSKYADKPQRRIKEGDIIQVKEHPTLLVVDKEGKKVGAYKIVWDYKGYRNPNIESSNGETYEDACRESFLVLTGGLCDNYSSELDEDVVYESLGY